MDHDLDLAPESHEEFPIPVPPHEEFFVSQEVLGFGRSVPAGANPSFLAPPREQLNVVTSFIDGSTVYGSNSYRALVLRTGADGMLKTSDEGRLLPLNFDAMQGFFHNSHPSNEPANKFFLWYTCCLEHEERATHYASLLSVNASPQWRYSMQ